MTRGGVHANFGMVDPDAGYATLRTKAIEIVGTRHAPKTDE